MGQLTDGFTAPLGQNMDADIIRVISALCSTMCSSVVFAVKQGDYWMIPVGSPPALVH